MKRKLTLRDKAVRAYNSMVLRCKANKNYQHIAIDTAWINNRELYIANFMQGYKPNWHLDKDLKVPYSNLYSADTCMFVPAHINNILRGKKSNSRGNADNSVVLPLGVSISKSSKNPYQAHCKINGKQTHLGLFSTPEAAHRAWQLGKIDQLQYALMDTELTSEIIEALEQWINIIICDVEAGHETKLD
ncbi:hypothetical protein R2200_002505 [Cronobacter malonaticus]|nr:hypothetical protein [Cronobacter malonaticus]ELQ6066760.1 hypothetical protein [Cronobacter malonaticus]